jgi:hypothetical protein
VIRLAAFIAALLALAAPARAAADFWVAATGSDSNAGTQASPFLTIGHADAAAVAGFGAGSTVHVAPGNYLGSLGDLLKNGTAASPITYLCDVRWSCLVKPTANESNNYAINTGANSGAATVSISAISSDSTGGDCPGGTPCIEVTLASTPAITLFNNQYIWITGVATNTAANGMWQIQVIDQTHVTLNNSAFQNSAGAAGNFRYGGAGAYTIFDGFEIDGTYPGIGTRWFTGIQTAGVGDVIRNMKVHDLAYPPGSNNGSNGGSCIADQAFYGGSQTTVYGNLVYHCGPKGAAQSLIHGIYLQAPQDQAYDNIVWGTSGVGIESWHDATALKVTNNTIVDAQDGGFQISSGDYSYPHILTATPANGSNVVAGILSTAGLQVGMGVTDNTAPSCIGSINSHHITSIDSATQIHMSANAGSSCNAGDTLYFGGPNTGSATNNNIVRGGTGTLGESGGNAWSNTFTNNNPFNTGAWSLNSGNGSSHTGDVATDPNFINYAANDGANSDYHLGPASPDIAAGTATNAPSFDFDGNPSPLGAAPEIGAYAYNPHPRALIDKFWNWLPGGYSKAFHKSVYGASTATTQGTNGFGGETRIFDLDGVGDLWLGGGLTVGWPATGSCGQGCVNAQSLYVNGVQLAPSPVPNPLINSSMEFDQQLAAAGTSYPINAGIGAPVKTLDGWNAAESAAATSLSVQQSASSPPPGFADFLRATVGTGSATVNAADYFLVYQPVEAANITNYGLGTSGAQPLCFAFYSEASVSNAVVGGAIQNAARTRSYPFIFVENATPNTWQIYSVCPPGDTGGTWVTSGAAEGLRVVFALEAGANFQTATVATAAISGLPGSSFVPIAGTVGAWAGAEDYGSSALTQLTKTTGATFDVTGVQLEQSSINNPFARPTQAVEIAQVQRYASRLAEPAANVDVGVCQATSASAQTCALALPTTMRAAPGACSIMTGTFKESIAGTATTWVSPTGGTNTQNRATLTTAITSDTAGNFHMLQGGGGSGVVYCSARL